MNTTLTLEPNKPVPTTLETLLKNWGFTAGTWDGPAAEPENPSGNNTARNGKTQFFTKTGGDACIDILLSWAQINKAAVVLHTETRQEEPAWETHGWKIIWFNPETNSIHEEAARFALSEPLLNLTRIKTLMEDPDTLNALLTQWDFLHHMRVAPKPPSAFHIGIRNAQVLLPTKPEGARVLLSNRGTDTNECPDLFICRNQSRNQAGWQIHIHKDDCDLHTTVQVP